ncbi:MAG: DUF4062 domain-containing protein [Deltaproteobacteria bacterium]|nr:DUF4062 domain-containing protein [Deltaproteobacteria bacterium]
MTDQPTPTVTKQRVVRVFISSTFRDMQEERNVLIKKVFPELRRRCRERGVEFVEVDLRWGVTEEQTERGEALPICLAEIDNCRPYFVGLLGERYGWVPDHITEELLETQPWLAEHTEHSVTALEILHGVLNNPQMTPRAFFYFRDPQFVATVPPDQRQDFTAENPESTEKLRRLKERIHTSGVALRENYPTPETAGNLILEDLWTAIDQEYPEGSAPDPLDREATEHEAFAESRAKVYVGRQEYFERLDRHVESEDPPLVVLGESGMGKSALLANWVRRYRQAHPDVLVLVHFIGSTQQSADYIALLRRLMGELKRRYELPQEMPSTTEELRAAFPNWLSMAAVKGRFVLVLDALNQLEDRDNAPDLIWLPEFFPPEVRVILSTLPGRALDALHQRGWPTFTVEGLHADERKQVIREYLWQYRKRLSEDRVERIAAAAQAANPLFLRALLEELRVFGRHEELDRYIAHYLEAPTVPDLYEKILARWEQDYEGDSDLVGEALSLLWAARRGLLETELLQLLGTNDQPLPQAVWSPFYLAAQDSLVSRSGLLGFFHDYLREAVRDTYLPTAEHQHTAHRRLANYFARQPLAPRSIDEFPWQLAQAQEWARLQDLLVDLPFLSAAWEANQFEVKAYWAQIEDHSPFRMAEAYRPVLNAPARHAPYIWRLATLLDDTGHPTEALSLRSYLVEYCRQSGDRTNLHAALGNQALILQDRGDLDGAWALLKEQERLCRELGDKAGLYATLGNQALILQDRGDLDGAWALHKEEERLCRELGDKAGLYATLGNQALILRARGDLDGAWALLKEQERLCRELGDPNGLATSLANQAFLLARDRSRPREALPLAEEAYRLATNHGLTALARQIEGILTQVRSRLGSSPPPSVRDSHGVEPARVSIPYPEADPERAMQLNRQYQQELARWKALPLWKRLMTNKPQPPTGI